MIVMIAAVRRRAGHLWWGAEVEAPGPAATAAFHSSLMGWSVVHQEPGASVLEPSRESMFMVFHLAEDYVRPTWAPVAGQQPPMAHLAVQVGDLDAAATDAESLGAELVDTQPQANVRVRFDPDGHPFCVCRKSA